MKCPASGTQASIKKGDSYAKLALVLDLRGEHQIDGVRVAEREREELTLCLSTESDSDELHSPGVTLGYTDDHIVDQRAYESVLSTLLDAVRSAGDMHLTILHLYGETGVIVLGQGTLGPLYGDDVVLDRYLYSGRDGYGKLSDS